jgi:hypothetical protein
MECIYITPELAKEWLKRNTKNRPLEAGKVAALKTVLATDDYRVNGETIKFDTEGALRDGQTRLTAIAESGIGAWSWVCYDIDPSIECFDSIDQVRPRTLDHLLSIRQTRNYRNVSCAARALYSLDERIPRQPGGFAPRVGLHILADHPELESSLRFVSSAGIKDVYSVGTAGTLHYLMRERDPELADKYWEALGTGVITNQRSPIRAVRDHLVQNKMATGDRKLAPRTILAIIIKGWNRLRKNQSCRYIRWNGQEGFPEIK